MAISLPSEDSAQFFTVRDCGLDAINRPMQSSVMTSLSAKVEMCINVTIEAELMDITALFERNIAATDFPTNDFVTFDAVRNLKGLNKLVKKMVVSSVPQRNK